MTRINRDDQNLKMLKLFLYYFTKIIPRGAASFSPKLAYIAIIFTIRINLGAKDIASILLY